MEWVETTGRTLEEAKEAALDQLGVAPEDAEFDVVEEPRSGLFGRVRTEARVRARVRPTSPRPKADRRDRRRKGADDAAPAADVAPAPSGRSGGRSAEPASEDADPDERPPSRARGARRAPRPAEVEATEAPDASERTPAPSRARGGRRAAPEAAVDTVEEAAPTGRARGGRRAAATPAADGAPLDQVADELAADVVGERAEAATPASGSRRAAPARRAAARVEDETEEVAVPAAAGRRGADVEDEPTLAEQGETVREFLEGLVDAFGADEATTVEVEEVDDETLEARVIGDDLGLLIGPKGATLQAVQEIARTVVQRAAEPGRGARLRIDIGGYREHRREALGRFTRQVAEQVIAGGDPVALEAMNAPDRKVVHDTVNEIDGVSSSSEGDDPNRRVVISPG